MSQFCGYTLELVLNDPAHTTITGIIKKIVDKELIVSNPGYLDGSKFKDKEVSIKGSEIRDLKVVELPAKKGKKKSKKKAKEMEPPEKHQEEKRQQSSGSRNHNDIDWNTENPTDVKKMEDFDFASNLQKFDKASVFKEISEQDDMDPTRRLVSMNKVDPEQRKYGNDEMVIKKHMDEWDNINGGNLKNGKHNDDSTDTDQFVDAEESKESSREASTLAQRHTSMPSRSITPIVDTQVRLVYSGTKETAKTCSPLQLSEIECLAHSKFHYGKMLLAENSARGIAELIISKVLGSFRVGSANHNTPPLILTLAGNNRAGCIALATGRQLLNHGVRVVTYLLHDFERSEEELTSEVKESSDMFESCGGKIVTSVAQLKKILSKLDSPLEFILDGLQGYDMDLNDFIEPEVSDSELIVNWCNEQDLPVMSIDIPSGLNASSGTSDFSTFLACKYLVSIGLPLNSILNLYKFGYFKETELAHFVVDSGIPKKVFSSKSSFRKFEKSWFSDSWSKKLSIL
ncbi:hypothetical protein FOA43_001662 [Brettanomyces nanus]|uniref:Enhancer of mRNA-decapping protein 3 n=1 Tax=Eeniella nana TaxID=13502 RepID=A0A875S1X4_EENNA|nr:uncharacterized protein FOA43_001662 [Brettanomyces nanus]QPG74335.1 hypothetical protein FOA43_001662 [Brettanomyces nanus]